MKCSSLGDGDVEGGVVFGGSVGVIFGSLVQDFAGWSWRLNCGAGIGGAEGAG